MTIEQKISMALAYKGMSQAALAREIGTSQANLNQRMKGVVPALLKRWRRFLPRSALNTSSALNLKTVRKYDTQKGNSHALVICSLLRIPESDSGCALPCNSEKDVCA